MQKKRNAIVKFSGGSIMLREVKPDGSELTTPGTWFTMGYIQEATLKNEFKTSNVTDETGANVKKQIDSHDVSVAGILEQSDKDTLDFLSDTCIDKYYQFYRYEGIVDGKHQEVFAPLCQVTPGIELKSGTKRPPFTIDILETVSDMTIAKLNFDASFKAQADVVVKHSKMYEIIETAIA